MIIPATLLLAIFERHDNSSFKASLSLIFCVSLKYLAIDALNGDRPLRTASPCKFLDSENLSSLSHNLLYSCSIFEATVSSGVVLSALVKCSYAKGSLGKHSSAKIVSSPIQCQRESRWNQKATHRQHLSFLSSGRETGKIVSDKKTR